MNSKLKMLIILFPFLYLLHDLEEIMTIESFIEAKSTIIPFRVTTGEFTLAFTLLWIIASIGCIKAFAGKPFLKIKPATYLSFLVPGILLANGIGHLVQLIVFKGYVPGIITTLMIIFPYALFALKFLFSERLLTLKRFLRYFSLGFVLQAPFALIAHIVSHFILAFF